MNWKLLEELSNAPGVSGYEHAVAEIFRRELKPIAKKIWTDNMGNVIAHIPGKGPKVAIDAHSDEVGFIVNHVDTDGFIRVIPIGGIDPRVFYAQRVIVHGTKPLIGVVGAVPPHLLNKDADRDKAIPIEDTFIDVGFPAEKVHEMVHIGDIVTFDSKFEDLGEVFLGKAFDDRIGIFILIEAAKNAKKIACDLYLVAAVQEERGLRGTGCAAFSVQPDIAIAIEGTVANNLPDVPSRKRLAGQNLGPEMRITDGRVIADRQLVDFLGEVATKAGIPHQFTVKSVGTTNATAIQTTGSGTRVAAISAPVRYIHGPNGIVSKSDVENQLKLVIKFLGVADKVPPRR